MEESSEAKHLFEALSHFVDEEFNLRQTDFRTRARQGERPYAESPTRASSSSSNTTRQDIVARKSRKQKRESNSVGVCVVSSSTQTEDIVIDSSIFSGIMAGSEVKVTAKFIGRFREGIDPENERGKHAFYTVHRWLRDAESRISSKGINTDEGKINEARLGVHPEIGDASAMLHSSVLAEITNWEEFKTQCKLFWRSEVEESPVQALLALIRTPIGSTTGETVAAHSQAMNDVINVAREKPQLRVGKAASWADKPDEELVSLKAMMLFISVAVFFGTLASRAQEILLKVLDQVKFENENMLTLTAKHNEEMHKQRVSASELSCFTSGGYHKGRFDKGRGKGKPSDNKESNSSKGTDGDDKDKGARRKKFKCYRCKGEGHIRRDCPSKPTQRERDSNQGEKKREN